MQMTEFETRLGQRIRSTRKGLGLTLDALAQRSGVARTTISKIERNLISPSFNTLAKIARGMNVKVTHLIDETRDEDQVLIRKKDRRILELNGSQCKIESLTKSISNMQIEVVKLSVEGGGDSGVDPPHAGEEFLLCLKGAVEFQLGDHPYKLNRGDAMHFKPNRESILYNRGSREAQVLWIFTPPRLPIQEGKAGR
jgi:transcriptional regulator with XRE-family HTH domain